MKGGMSLSQYNEFQPHNKATHLLTNKCLKTSWNSKKSQDLDGFLGFTLPKTNNFAPKIPMLSNI